MKLGILIPTLDSRIDLFKRVSDELGRQIDELYSHLPPREVVSIIHLADSGKHTTGKKRNALIELAVKEYKPEYIAFFDDDDMPGPTYIKRGIEVVEWTAENYGDRFTSMEKQECHFITISDAHTHGRMTKNIIGSQIILIL